MVLDVIFIPLIIDDVHFILLYLPNIKYYLNLN